MMIGTKIYKDNYNQNEYSKCAIWCNNNEATIEDKGEYYEVVTIPVNEQTPEEIQAQLTEKVQHHMDNTVKTRGYDGILSVCSYVDTGNAKFDAEGAACRKWRSAVWTKCYEILAEYQKGVRGIPTAEEVFAELPILEW